MTKTAIAAIICLLFLMPVDAFSNSLDDPEVIELFMTAREFFKTIESEDYSSLWERITAKSHKKIIGAIYKNQKSDAKGYSTRDQIKRNFDICGVMCKSFWDGYFKAFDPHDTLNRSKWDLGNIKKEKAEIWITHPSADRPAKLKMVREDGIWKVGLMESL